LWYVERDLELHQMDVKTVFINGYLNEDIYMQPLKGYVNPIEVGMKFTRSHQQPTTL
jgi:hypothetical protein